VPPLDLISGYPDIEKLQSSAGLLGAIWWT